MTQSAGVVMGGTVGSSREPEEVGKEVAAEEKARGDLRDVIPTVACEVEEVKLVLLTKENSWYLMQTVS